MARYIDADALKARLDYCVTKGMGSTIAFTFKHMIDEQPTENVVERKMGEWKNVFHGFGTCSECDRRKVIDNYCPNCGAEMRKGKKKDDRA